MAITDRTRKILWIKAGGRCSICQVLVVTEETDEDEPAVFGQEAHIVSGKPKGPRTRQIINVDSYENLILLCSKHHKQVDDQVLHFTEERLKNIKQKHELWIASIDKPTEVLGPVRLIPDPTKSTAKVLKIFTIGSALWNFVDGSYACYPSWPDVLSDENEDLIAVFLDDLRDWIDVAGGNSESFQAKRDAAKGLGEYIKSLARAGFLVGARERFCLLTGGTQDNPSSWRVVDIQIHFAATAELVNTDDNPLDGEAPSERSL